MKIQAQWVERVRFGWTAGFTFLFLLNLDQFGFAAGLGPAPKYWSVGVFLVTAALFLPGFKPKQLLRKPLVWWALGYLLMSALWVGVADNLESAIDGLVMVVTTCLYVGIALLAYPSVKYSGGVWTAMLWVVLLLAVASILQEYFNPAAYVFAEAGQGIQGRAAGLYQNPNSAAQTLVMILALLMLHGTAKTNLIALLVTLVGLLLTFSRGGLVAWALLVIVATVRGRLTRWLIVVLLFCMVMIMVAGSQLLDAIATMIPRENQDSLDRIAWLLGQGKANYDWGNSRDYLAEYAWSQFLTAPTLGHGLGAMWVWAGESGSHNMILRHLVEYGIGGVLIFPFFLVFSLRSAPQDADRRWLILIALVVLMLGMFSHNMLEQGCFVFAWLALCLPAANQRRAI